VVGAFVGAGALVGASAWPSGEKEQAANATAASARIVKRRAA
jgi:hypothetical protein